MQRHGYCRAEPLSGGEQGPCELAGGAKCAKPWTLPRPAVPNRFRVWRRCYHGGQFLRRDRSGRLWLLRSCLHHRLFHDSWKFMGEVPNMCSPTCARWRTLRTANPKIGSCRIKSFYISQSGSDCLMFKFVCCCLALFVSYLSPFMCAPEFHRLNLSRRSVTTGSSTTRLQYILSATLLS